MGDYNVEITEINISSSCEIYHLTNIIKQPTSFRNPSNLSCIDTFLAKSRNIEFLENIFLKFLNKHAPNKSEILPGKPLTFCY